MRALDCLHMLVLLECAAYKKHISLTFFLSGCYMSGAGLPAQLGGAQAVCSSPPLPDGWNADITDVV